MFGKIEYRHYCERGYWFFRTIWKLALLPPQFFEVMLEGAECEGFEER